ncbi:uncharacterized protein DNG_07640 [Cephalotrichum gorgonifer]|uniref:Uncharacterized protein n=1 Tax=Cephalotrichum gorgonifer TaxID=2041049 RepID=A0AAE8N256_9PEZI|nr:uncharacterized protein DNG_07640 [Cephalotrichum gorgonifer]
MATVVQGQGIIDAITSLTAQMRQNHQETQKRMLEMQHQITGLHDRLDALSVEMRARDMNNHARLANNALVRKGDQILEPLFNYDWRSNTGVSCDTERHTKSGS